MSATLGGLLKDYRLQKNISQLEISFAVGWKEPSRLSRIEQGRVGRPKRELLNRIMNAMKLNTEERGRLLLAGGYIPTKEEISSMKKQAHEHISSWNYPAYILDFSHRILDWNQHTADVYGIKSASEERFRATHPSFFQVLYAPDFAPNSEFKDADKTQWHEALLTELVQFRSINFRFSNDRWYQETIATMMSNELFASLWQKAGVAQEPSGIAHYQFRTLVQPTDHSRHLAFHLFTSHLIEDARYQLVFHVPVDPATIAYFYT